MAERTSSSEPLVRSRTAGIDEQLWPIVCATMVLAGILGVIVSANSDFEEQSLFLNGYTHLAGLGCAAALVIFIASQLKGAVRRTAELAILLSLVLHAAAGVGAFYLFTGPMGGSSLLSAARDASPEFDDDSVPPDFHWAQDDEQQPEQAFEQAVVTTIREQAPPAAEVQPRDRERPAPVVNTPRVPDVEITPLGVGGGPEPGGPLDIRRPDAAKIEEAKPPEALAMIRQKEEALPLPKSESPAPAALPEAPKEPPKTPESAAVQADKIDWAHVAKKAATPNNEPLPPPRKMARVEVQPGESLPALNIVARLPSQAPPQTSNNVSGAEAADRITQQGSTLERSSRDGAPLPSTVVPDAGLPAQSPAAPGSSPASRLEAVSTVPVEKSDTSRAPLGPTIASSGNQDYGRGSTLFPSRRGAIGGRGKAQPSIEGDSREDPSELRAGSPGSDLSRGLPLPSAPARRAIASQTEGGGSGAASSLAARLPRTQSEMGLDFPAAAKITQSVTPSGAGGAASSPGGLTSTLDVGQRIAIRRSAGSGTPRNFGMAAPGVGDLLPGNDTSARGNVAVAVGQGSIGPRRADAGTPDGNENGVGSIPRARSEIVAPHPTAIPVGPVAGTASVTSGPMPGGTSQGYGAAAIGSGAIGPSARLGGIGRREGAGLGVGSRPSGQVEPSEIASQIGVTSLQPSGAGGRGGRGDGQLDQILSGGGLGAAGGISRGNSPLVVSGQVHEPMEPFRRGALHGGPAIGDSAGGQFTEPAIENGLEYFSHTQFNDGHWSLHELPAGIAADPASLGSLHADTAATGLALLTYLGAGYTHQDEKYRDVVRRGAEWLIKHQQSDGNLSYHGAGPANDPTNDPTQYYSHGIATMALCEAYGMTQDRELREAAQKAINFIVKSQDPHRGGWRYTMQGGSDTSVTGWQLMALRSAQMAELDVPEETLRNVSRWLDLAQVPNRGTYVYNPWNSDRENALGRAPNPTMTAQAMVMRMYLGQDRGNAALGQGADYLLAHLPEVGTVESPQRDCYYWYHAAQAMYFVKGDYWKTWDARVTPLLRAGQIDHGPLKGSWSPREPVPDRWSAHGGRHYVTSMHILTLEFPYWHLPLFRELRKE